MITSPHNQHLKTIRRLHDKRHRERTGLLVAEGEDLVAAARLAGFEPEVVLEAGTDVEPELLHSVSSLGSGTRVVGVYRQRWGAAAGEVSVYLQGVGDPGNVGAVIRSAHALSDGAVCLGPGCADPWSPKAVRASMGSVFARPPARVGFGELPGATLALVPDADLPLSEAEVPRPLFVCVGSEREGLPGALVEAADAVARIPLRPGGPGSLNAAMAATVALYDLTRMADHA